MTAKKATRKSSSSAKKKDSGSKSGHSRSASKGKTHRAGKAVSKVASKVVKKTKEVLGEALPPAAQQPRQAQADGQLVKDLPELVALAEMDVAIKRAAVKAAKAQQAMAEAKVKIYKLVDE